MDGFTVLMYIFLFLYSGVSFALALAVSFNFLFKLNEKTDKLKSIIMDNIILVICISMNLVLLFAGTWGLIIYEIELVFSTFFYTSEWIINKANKFDNPAVKDLYKNNIVFVINVLVYVMYVLSEVILQLTNLKFISVDNEEFMVLLKCHEAAILILLAIQLLLGAIKRLRKMKQNCDVKNLEEKDLEKQG